MTSTDTYPPKAQYVTTSQTTGILCVRLGTFLSFDNPVDTTSITCDDNQKES